MASSQSLGTFSLSVKNQKQIINCNNHSDDNNNNHHDDDNNNTTQQQQQQPKKRKIQKSFPNINQLLAEAAKAKIEIEKQNKKRIKFFTLWL